MGFHSVLQANGIPLEGVMAKVWNRKIFAQIRKDADAASKTPAEERGPCPDAEEFGIMERFSNKMAIAPTASISIIKSEEHTSELQSLMRISYAVFCLKKKKQLKQRLNNEH